MGSKAFFLIIVLFTFFQEVVSQEKNKNYETVKDGFEEYLEFISNSNWDGIGEKIYPEVFSIVSKSDLIEAFKGIQSQGFWMRFGPIEKFDLIELNNDIPNKVSEVFFGQYESAVYILLDKDLEYTADDINRLKAVLPLNPKYSNMVFNSEKKEFSLKTSSQLIAIKTEKWYYLEIEPSQLSTIEIILSKKISDEIAQLMAN